MTLWGLSRWLGAAMEEFCLFPFEDLSPLHFEERARRKGFRAIAGIDEAGRGPLAGPVVAAVVILPDECDFDGLTDSKKLSEEKRLELYPVIRKQAVAVGVGVSSVSTIDEVNILQATLLAMQKAIGCLKVTPDYIIVDGNTPIPTSVPQLTLKKGDSLSLSVAAASVVAKVIRDRIMVSLDRFYPGYGFAQHKGYGCESHREAIRTLKPCRHHRLTFRGVREFVEEW